MRFFRLPLFRRSKAKKARATSLQSQPSNVQGVLIAPSEAPRTYSTTAAPCRDCFQVQLGGVWQDLDRDADEQLRCAVVAGLRSVTLEARGQLYECSLYRMEQRNLQTGRVRRLRAPQVATSDTSFHQPATFEAARRWEEEEEEEDEEEEESLGSASPSHGTPRRMRPKVAVVTAAGVVTGASVCVVGGDHLFGDGELYAGLAEATEGALDWAEEATKSVGDFLENVL
mmetsp:Transcript_118979/g.237175  ORF Transcript_118979/g.237175 Transcript_118979/m.237175 type:complete len:228 (-) Transcript_118979:157-840(-)